MKQSAKNSIKMVVALLLVGAISAKAADIEQGIKILSTKMDIMYLKVSDDLIGGVLTVVDASGKNHIKMTIENRKVIVDFLEEQSGDYVIHIEKSGHVEEVKYHKS